MTEFAYFWEAICGLYLVGGITIGYYFCLWKLNRKDKRNGTGRWDFSNRRYRDDDQ